MSLTCSYNNNINKKRLDSYSMLICTKYFEKETDFVNLVCVNSKFKETTEKLRYNPISIKSLKLFPKMQTQYLYSQEDETIKGVENREIWYQVNYDQYLNFRENNIKCHYVVYTKEDSEEYDDEILDGVNMIGNQCFSYNLSLKRITIPSTVKSLGKECFGNCDSLESVTLPSSLQSLNDDCFICCFSLTSITLPSALTSLGNRCFYNCQSLVSIDLPSSLQSINDECFHYCWKLKSVNLPVSLTSLGNCCFGHCGSLETINLPTNLQLIGNDCFLYCQALQSISLLPAVTSLGIGCFCGCQLLKGIISAPTNCF
ncbi:hypothetical protein QTN25_004378 [Entamoeba marina]